MFCRSLGEFGATITFVGNISNETRTLPLAMYSLMQQPDTEAAIQRLIVLSLSVAFSAMVCTVVSSLSKEALRTVELC